MIGDRWSVYWDNYMSNSYTYGTTVQFNSVDSVEFSNALMPAGEIIKKWYSKTNYQAHKIEPSLPIIDGEGCYELETDISMDVNEGVFVRLVFFNKYDIEVGHITVRDKAKRFRCPLATHKYEIHLVNAGAKKITFHSITIREVEDEPKEHDKESKKKTKKGKRTSR